MKANLRISIKDFQRNKNSKIQALTRVLRSSRQFWVRMNGELTDEGYGGPSLTRLLTAGGRIPRQSAASHCQ